MKVLQLLSHLWTHYIVFYTLLVLRLINIPAMIYDYLFTKLLTKQTYLFMFRNNIAPRMKVINSVLDIGVGTGTALSAISGQLGAARIVGIDIDRNYIARAKQIFRGNPKVEIREQNFYELASSSEKYDLIVFSSSFMLMPDRERALEIAKTLLNKNGRIIFLMTLYDSKKRFRLIEKIKPYLKYYTTVDFGKLVYESELGDLIEHSRMHVVKKDRVFFGYNPLFHIFRFFCVECEPRAG